MNRNIFDGRYEFIRVIGEGGMGKVYLAKNIKLGTYWAIKKIKKHTANKIDFLAEPNILKKLDHPAIVRIFDIDEDEDSVYVVEEFVEGVTIEHELEQNKYIDEAKVVEWAKQICEALIYIHSLKPPIIYRDMKPSNVMITKENQIKIIDFGIAREYKHTAESDTTYIGTKGYAAPEQYGTAQTDGRTDIYSLGVTLYHISTGVSPNEPPYEILPIRQIREELSEGLEYIIGRCTKLNPFERYQSAEQLMWDLNNIEKFNSQYKKVRFKNNIKVILALILLLSIVGGSYKAIITMRDKKIAKYKDIVNSAVSLKDTRQYDEAITKLNEAITSIPSRLEAPKEIAKTYINKGDNEKCISYIENEIIEKSKNDIKDAEIYYILATAYFNNKDYVNASENLIRAYERDNSEVVYLRDLAVCYARMGNLNKAEKELNKIIEMHKAEEVSWYVKGEINAAKNKPEEAINNFNQCIALAKGDEIKEKAFISIAKVYGDNKDKISNAMDKKISTLERASTELKEKNNPQILEMLGGSYYDKGMASGNNKKEFLLKSADYFNQLLSLGYKSPYIYRNIAIINQQIGEFQASEESLMKMKKIYPNDCTCYMQLALLYADMESKKPNEQRDYKKTEENYKLAVKYAPKGEDTPELKPIKTVMVELKNNGWLK